MTSNEEADRSVISRTCSALSWLIVWTLLGAYVVTDLGVGQAVHAQEADVQDDDSTRDTNETNDTDQDPADKETDKEADNKVDSKKEDSPPAKKRSTKKADKDEPVDNEEQEQAEDAADEEVSEEQENADKAEDAKAAAEEAAGAEVEIDESDEEEVEPDDSAAATEKPPVVEEQKKPPKEKPAVQKRVIGATATIMEKQSELLFKARVDSGAKSCSLHIEDYKIEDEAEQMADNIGKVIRFNIKNGNDESHWLEAKISGYVVVKTAAHRERRYKVPLTLRFKDFEKSVLVTLNNREKMEYPLLLGRNFLMGDFVVDVEMENNELHTR